MNLNTSNDIVLAFSGGLDTSFCVVYLRDQGFNVITVTVDTGGFSEEEKNALEKKSNSLGSIEHHYIDARGELFSKFISYTIKGNVLRGGVYPLSASCERYIQASKVIEIAINKGITNVAHGSTGAGNDQIRFDLTIKNLAPKLEIITPIRSLRITREEEARYLQERGYQVDKKTTDYSINSGFLGNTIGGRETLDSWSCPPDDVYPNSNSIEKTPDIAEIIILTFKNGLPVSINNEKYNSIDLLKSLIEIGNKHGVGRGIHLGNTILGIKGRIAFEAPAAIILHKAHTELEKLVLTKLQLFWKNHMGNLYGDLLHEGQYFDPLMRDIESMIDSSQKFVTGMVKIKLFKGNVIVQGVKSSFSLMNKDVAMYGEKNILWDGKDAEGFCKIYGLQGIIANNVQKKDVMDHEIIH